MSKKSNKTAHVLNLLAKHDAAKGVEEPSSMNGESSDETAGQASPSAPAGQKPANKEGETAVISPSITAPAKAPAAPQNNISLIDTTGEDPVADLIQENLSKEFEKQMQESQSGISETEQASLVSDPNSEEVASASNSNPADNESEISETGSMDDEAVLDADSADSIDDEAVLDADSADFIDDEAVLDADSADSIDDEAVLDADSADSIDDEAVLDADSADSIDDEAVLDDGSIDDEALLDDDSIDEAALLDDDSIDEAALFDDDSIDEAALLDDDSIDEAALSETGPMENEEAADGPIPTGTGSESDSGLQETSPPNNIEETNPLSETEEEMGAMAETEADLESEPTEQDASAPLPAAEPDPMMGLDFVSVNVMERIVNDNIIYFMRQFDVCTCERCKADAIAMTLNGLMPKYIVTMPSAVDPLLSFYTNRLISDVTVEATKACMAVKDNPRH